MELSIHSPGKKASSTMKVSKATFAYQFNEGLVHQVVTAYLAGGRAGTKAQKTRAEVRGGGIKPWRQKGTGRARAGSSRSPLWRAGGVTFAAKPRDFSQKVNRKMYNKAMASILSELNRLERFFVVDELKLSAPKTKELKEILNQLKIESALIVIDGEDKNVYLDSRNLIGVSVCDAAHVDPVSLVGAEHVLATVDAVKKLEERLA